MAEHEDVVVNVLETKKIDITKIKMSNIQARQDKVTKGLEIFAEQIRKIGLIQPVVVYETDGGMYELIVGQRRFFAHQNILKWPKILAMIIKKPKDDSMATTISWLENHARQKMSNKDMMRHVSNLYSQKTTINEIKDVLRLTDKQVKGCIALPRVPDVVRASVESGEMTPDIAVKATDAKKFDKFTTDESKGDDVLALAKLMLKNKLLDKQIDGVVEYGENNPDASNEELVDGGISNTLTTIQVDLTSSDNKRLARYQEDNDYKNKSQAAAALILSGLTEAGD